MLALLPIVAMWHHRYEFRLKRERGKREFMVRYTVNKRTQKDKSKDKQTRDHQVWEPVSSTDISHTSKWMAGSRR
jgi:hypothetical protein